ncbi:prolipoprotein diacylglyceryl transferase [Mycoplasma sp. Ms02]|uniref:prolipoprotein diacylglyceryl transferase n=1 Tax=Mycoplasma sp. Ms02 TaxID=353851 RepID=UPI001C8A311F|nr:prolipoprotein diacylglyceryl transferase [Mycoplasma sp. Ms02]QZE12084.1 prolipoprotein diacylglyceryl transferase [Mycoplasma sp. Ms02]
MENQIWKPEYAFTPGENTPLFTIGSYSAHVYSFMIMFGILASVLTIAFFWMREKYKIETLLTLVIITIPMSFIGARLGYVIEALIYQENPFQNSAWWKVWEGGLSIQGGIIVAFIADMLYVYYKRKEIDMRKAMSFIIPTILIGQVIGRWGNYANHEVYGQIDWTGKSVLIFGKNFASNMFITDSYSKAILNSDEGAYRVPLFLYESLLNLVGYLIIVWVFNLFGIFKPGSTSGLYFFFYGIVRIVMEPMRQESFGLYTYTAAIFIIFGALLFIYFQFLSRVLYKKEWKKYYYTYTMINQEQYNLWVDKTCLVTMLKRKFKKVKNV